MKHFRQRSYENIEGNRVSERYPLYKTSNYRRVEIEEDITLDELSYKYYGTPLYYWVIGEFNNIKDPFVKVKKGENLKIPVL